MRFDPSSRFGDSKSSFAGVGGHFGSGSNSLVTDHRASKVPEPVRGGYENHGRRFDRQPPSVSTTAGSSVVTRRVVQEIPSIRRDTRPAPPSPPPARDRLDDRRVVDRGRDDR